MKYTKNITCQRLMALVGHLYGSKSFLVIFVFFASFVTSLSYVHLYPLRDYDLDSEQLVVNMLELPSHHECKGHLIIGDRSDRVAKTLSLVPWMRDWIATNKPIPYGKQFGLYGYMLSKVQNLTSYSSRTLVIIGQCLASVLHAFVFSIIALCVWKSLDRKGAWIFCIMALFYPGIWRWSYSLYWPSASSLAIIAWCWFFPIRKWRFYLSGAFVLFVIRFLGGYEYISCVSLGAVSSLYGNSIISKYNIKLITVIQLFVISVLAFVIAVTFSMLHLMSLGASYYDALQFLIAPLKYRTFGMADVSQNKPIIASLANMVSALLQNGTGLVLFIASVVLGSKSFRRLFADVMEYKKFVLWFVFSLVASLSWNIFGYGHAKQHPHLCNVIYLQPAIWVCFYLIAKFYGNVLSGTNLVNHNDNGNDNSR